MVKMYQFSQNNNFSFFMKILKHILEKTGLTQGSVYT